MYDKCITLVRECKLQVIHNILESVLDDYE